MSPAKYFRARLRRAFTLVEMLVVIAITVILFALLLRPLVESLRLTNSAQVQAAAQDAGRITLERITRELGSAVYVYDNNSHPFANATGTAPAGAELIRFTNFLDLPVTESDGTVAVEHAYNAKLDIVPARHTGSSATMPLLDPTAGNEPIHLKPTVGSATVSSNGLLFPLAPGSYLTRYFVALKNPALPYTNSNEGLLAAASTNGDNTYILYVAQVQPYKSTTTTTTGTGGNPPTSSMAYGLNTDLFTAAADGKTPELDDPDFFRYVASTDVNWLSADHHTYTASELAAHNMRVDNWYKIAKPVITAPDIDLLLLPHNPDGSIAYDTAGPLDKVAHSGTDFDPVSGAGKDAVTGDTTWPVVNTSVTFSPGTVEGDAAPGTTTDYASVGIPTNAADNGGLPYVPTLYTASNQSLVNPPIITLSPNVGNGVATNVLTYATDLFSGAASTVVGATISPGDLVEYYHPTGSATGTPVFDVTTGVVMKGVGGTFVPMAVNTNTGTINFDTPALPAPPNQNSALTYDPYSRFWEADAADLNSGNLLACQGATSSASGAPGVIDLTQLFCSLNVVNGVNHYPLSPTGSGAGGNTSPLSVLGLTSGTTAPMPTPGPLAAANAFVVPGSVRVYGPDATPGPGLGARVLYSQVGPGTPLNYDEYRVDYLNSLLYFYVDSSHQLPTTKTDGSTADPVQIAFDYQANLAPADATKVISSSSIPAMNNPANPLLVKVDYQTRDLLDINIGVRIYDSSQGHSIVVPVHNQVQIGNSNR